MPHTITFNICTGWLTNIPNNVIQKELWFILDKLFKTEWIKLP